MDTCGKVRKLSDQGLWVPLEKDLTDEDPLNRRF